MEAFEIDQGVQFYQGLVQTVGRTVVWTDGFKTKQRTSELQALLYNPVAGTGRLKGTLGPRPPYEEPRSPLHPGSPNQGPQDSVILAYAWVVPSGLIGDRQSPRSFWVNPRSLYRDRSLPRGPNTE
eukprot:scaffold194_cov357-Pavlova_lutheri.AAC.1